MSEKNWPSSLKKYSLIPKSIQVVNSIISSDPELQLEYSKKLTQNYIKSSKNIIVSLSKSKDEHSPRISNIFVNCIKDLGLEFIAAPDELKNNSSYKYIQNIHEDTPFEYIAELTGLPCDKSIMEDGLRGGAALVRDYNTNPLKAYINWRLGIRPQTSKLELISNFDRGRIAHKALEIIWKQLVSSDNLRTKTVSQILSLITTSIDESFIHVLSKYHYQPKSIYQNTEKKILQKSIFSLLMLEARRPSFIVEYLEYRSSYSHKGFSINLQIDRIDRLSSNEYLLMDYKINPISNKGWTDEDLTDPQLPLYVLVLDNKSDLSVNSICYNFIRLNEKQGMSGIKNKISKVEIIDGIKEYDEKDWSHQILDWEESINKSIGQIINGSILINLKNIKKIDSAFKSKLNQNEKLYNSLFRFQYARYVSENELKKLTKI